MTNNKAETEKKPRYPRVRSAIERMEPYTPPTDGRGGKLRLDFNENTVGCSPRVVRVLRNRATAQFLSVYPEYLASREKIAPFFGVQEDQLTFTDGTDEAIQLMVHTYVDPGQEVLMSWPTFPIFRLAAESVDAKVSLVRYPQKTLSFPLKKMIRAIGAKTRLILIANPNNPTASAIGLNDIELILQAAPQAAVLIDEAYFEFFGITALDLLTHYPNLFVSRTFSKVYGMAGLRIGCLFSQKENIAMIRKFQSPYSVNSLAVACALEAVQDQKYIRNYVDEIFEARKTLCEGLDQLGLFYYPSQANFVLVRFGRRAAMICKLLREYNFLVRDRTKDIPGTIRITVGTRRQVKTMLKALGEVMGR
ncbi:MAG: histidinol-phosphate transaminase [Solibacterales bacterium]|nr:histidinol-phosphate transaminase [Bryobacterales bacterium]|tara:strand:+ start:13386 stop:14477 length:1092 start_codon:yes stop_codon:yes gene_type:complete